MNDDEQFEVLPAGEMRQKNSLTADNRPTIKLDPLKLPEPIRHLVSLAERFGVSDDLIRADLIGKTSSAELDELRRIVRESDCILDEWLAGPEANGPTFSPEYIAFSCMRMAADGC